MTPDLLQHLIAELAPGPWPGCERPAALLAALEAAADARPHDRALAGAVREAARLASADRGLPARIAGIHREHLVRWDADSTTWAGPGPDGRAWMVRVLRPHVDEPALRRALARDARALQAVLPGVRADGPAIVAPAPGQPLDAAIEGPPERIVQLLGAGLADLLAWEQLGLGLPALSAHELRAGPRQTSIVCLTPAPSRDMGPHLAQLAARLVTTDGAAASLLAGLVALPPRTAAEAVEHTVAALAQDLAGRRHTLHLRRHHIGSALRLARLHELVARLDHALPPPPGRGAVGVDLEGRVTVVEGDADTVRWGPPDATRPIWTREEGFDAPLARRLLRARAHAAPSARLQAEIGGDPSYTEAVGRWLAAGLRLRTVRLLLDKTLSGR